MSLALNKIMIAGRLTADPELKSTTSGISVCQINVAVDRKNFSKEKKETVADFISVVAWRSTAEFICKYFKKGSPIFVDGTLQSRQYTDKEGNKRVAWEVQANEVAFVESAPNTGAAPADTAAAKPAAAKPTQAPAPAGDFNPDDDELPF